MSSVHGVVGRVARAAAIGVGLLVVLAPPASAQIRQGDFSCRASAGRNVTNPPLPANTIEPAVANAANSPCRDARAGLLQPTTVGPLTAAALRAETDVNPNDPAAAPAAEGDRALATAEAENSTITIGTTVINVALLSSTASYTCQGGQPVAASASRVVGLVIAGTPVNVPAGPQTITTPVGTLFLNQTIREPERIIQRAFFLDTPLDDLFIAEAIADITGNPCALPAQQRPECSDGRDNDGDGRIDFPNDPDCTSPEDNSEAGPPECSDGRDNDGDGKIDFPNDPDCTSPQDNSEGGKPECSDGRDNDGDGRIDFPNDPDCTSAQDNSEAAGPQCSDGVDNDGDGRTDFPNDPDCSSAQDNTESGPGSARLGTQPSSIGRLGLNGACVRRSFRAIVTGRNIRRVAFSLDGRSLGTDRSAPFATRIATGRTGAHRVVARVTFTESSNTNPRTLQFGFRRCAPKVQFTG